MAWKHLVAGGARIPTEARLIVGFGIGALIMVLSPFRNVIIKAAAGGHLHMPDLAMLQRLSVATKIHVASAIAAMLLGVLIFSLRKGRLSHRLMGWLWLGLAVTCALSSFLITSLNPGHWSGLHLFSVWVLGVAPLAAFRARRHDVTRHRQAVVALFFGGFVINLLFAFLPGRALWRVFFG